MFILACQCSSCFSLTILTSLVNKGANVNAQTSAQYTPLIFSIFKCLIKLLLNY